MKELKAKGYMLFAISGSFSEVVQLIAKHYGFDQTPQVQLF
jgi:phosphoserine phosphatase